MRGGFRLRRLEMGIRLVERRAADEALREQLLLPLELTGGRFHRRPCRARLGRPGRRGLVRRTRIDAHQDLAGAHLVTGADLKR